MSTETGRERRANGTFNPTTMSEEIMKTLQETSTITYRSMNELFETSCRHMTAPGMNGGGEGFFRDQGNLFRRMLAGLNAMNAKAEIFMNFARQQQESNFEICRAHTSCLRKVTEIYRAEGPERAVKTCLESAEGLVDAIESAVAKGSGACFNLFRSCLPKEHEPVTVQKEKSS